MASVHVFRTPPESEDLVPIQEVVIVRMRYWCRFLIEFRWFRYELYPLSNRDSGPELKIRTLTWKETLRWVFLQRSPPGTYVSKKHK